jgi:arsenite methyltransferase
VADRVQICDGDARRLPFADAVFDVVVSSLALHNIYVEDERAQAVSEIARVLRPGGRVMIWDIQHTGQYARVLQEAGLRDVRRAGPSFLWAMPSYVLTAIKPRGEEPEEGQR